MAGADLTSVTPTWMEPQEPEFHTIMTQSESMKKNYANLSGSTPILKWKCKWQGLSDTSYYLLYQHFYDNKGGYDSFAFKCVPSYIDTDEDGVPDGSAMTGRWVEGTFKTKLLPRSWDLEIVFEKAVA